MSDYTKGPWRVIRKEHPVGYAEFEIAWSDDDELVCDIVYEEADANLMSAAPELLEALKDAVYALEVCGKDYDYVMGRARDAIAKAEP